MAERKTPTIERQEISLAGGWHTWFDEAVAWQSEPPAPAGTPVEAQPVRPPSVGWDEMEWNMETLRLPGSWERVRPGYRGVAWHWRPIYLPEEQPYTVVRLRFAAVARRAEVFLDRAMVGYHLGDGPFVVDLTGRVQPGVQHELAVRVTYPGPGPLRWGAVELPPGLAAGGMPGEVTLITTGDAWLQALRASSWEDRRGATLRCRVHNRGRRRALLVTASASAPDGANAGCSPAFLLTLGAGEEREVALPLRLSAAPSRQPEAAGRLSVSAQLHGAGLHDALSLALDWSASESQVVALG